MIKNESLKLDYQRFVKKKLKMGNNKREFQIRIGDVVLIPNSELVTAVTLGVCAAIQGGDAMVRTGGKQRKVAIATLAPLVASKNKEETMAAPHEATHFLSLELNNDHQMLDKIEVLQDQLQNQLYGEILGKRYKRKALHITMAVMSNEH